MAVLSAVNTDPGSGASGAKVDMKLEVVVVPVFDVDRSKAISELIDGLGPNGKLMVIGPDFDSITVTPGQLIFGCRNIKGWAAGPPAESEDTLRFAELGGVGPMIETYPLEEAGEAHARMTSGNAKFRVVLTM
jgi:D-arabinose 1-dehydrogenase-like Zn-dependent alcohol dehydrogenase